MAYDSTNIFAKILRGDIPAKKIYENDYALAFYDIAPQAKVHVIVIPKGEFVSFDDFMAHGHHDMVCEFFKAVRHVAHDMGLHQSGYRLISNHGADAGQLVPHFHVHLCGGEPLGHLLVKDT